MVFAICSLEKFKHKGKKHPKGITVCQYTKDGELIRCFLDAIDASKVTGISQPCISNASRGKQKTAGGYKWEQHKGLKL